MFNVPYPALVASALLFGLCQGQAAAHANAGIDAIDAIGDRADGLAGVETTIGYLRPIPSAGFSWVCHEGVTQPDALITPQYVENQDGTMLVTVGDLAQAKNVNEAVYRSTDGCDWSTTDGLSNHRIADIRFDPLNPDRAMAVSNTEGTINGVFVSLDAGATWDLVYEGEDGRVFTSVRFAETHEGYIWVASMTDDGRQHIIHRSRDGGSTWAHHSLPIALAGEEVVHVALVALDLENPDTAWISAGPFLDDTLYRTTDGGQSFEPVYHPQAAIIDGALDDEGAVWLVVSGNKVLRSTDGETFSRLETAPLSIGVEAVGGHVVLATRVASAGTALSTCASPEYCETTPTFEVLNGPPECPQGSDSVNLCEPLWPALERSIFGRMDSGSPDAVIDDAPEHARSTKPSSSGCAHLPSSSPTAISLWLIVLASAGSGRSRSKKNAP